MKSLFATIAVSLVLMSCATTPGAPDPFDSNIDPLTELPHTLTVTSSTLEENLLMPDKTVFDGFGCTEQNVSPQLRWSEGPSGTKSYLVMLYDPDAPTGIGFHHWWVANIPPQTRSLSQGVRALPEGSIQGLNDYGTTNYGGPCPPDGRTHRYLFYVWALGVEALPLTAQTSPAVVRFMLAQNALAVGRLQATYGR